MKIHPAPIVVLDGCTVVSTRIWRDVGWAEAASLWWTSEHYLPPYRGVLIARRVHDSVTFETWRPKFAQAALV